MNGVGEEINISKQNCVEIGCRMHLKVDFTCNSRIKGIVTSVAGQNKAHMQVTIKTTRRMDTTIVTFL